MNATPPNSTPESPWPGPKLLGLIALILRATLGFGLLSEGLANYFMRGRGGMTPMGNLPFGVQQFVPVVQICIGLALVLGFLSVIAAVGSAVLGLLLSAYGLFQAYVGMVTTGNPGMFLGNSPFLGSMPSLLGLNTSMLALHQVAVIFLANATINRYSIDALVFRREEDARPQGPAPRSVDGRRDKDPDEHLIA